MPYQLCLTVTFLDPRFHGRRDGGEPEWPPSPLRLFQAIVAAAAAPTGRVDNGLADALRWLERLPPPRIIAPKSCVGAPYRLSVPNNAMDLVAKAWAKGNYDGSGDSSPPTHRTMKTVRPMLLLGGDQVRYIWTLPQSPSQHERRSAEAIRAAVRSVVALGWGVDLVVGDGQLGSTDSFAEDDTQSMAEHWLPGAQHGGVPSRTPAPGTFDALVRRHADFLNRVTQDGFVPVPPLTAFSRINYRRANEPAPRPIAAFSLLRLNATTDRDYRAFSTPGRTLTVAGMVRHALAVCAQRAMERGDPMWTLARINEIIHGHTPDGRLPMRSEPEKPRLSYVPLPSIESHGRRGSTPRFDHVGDIRRVLIVGNGAPGTQSIVRWAEQVLAGELLTPLKNDPLCSNRDDEDPAAPCAMLSPIADNERTVRRYAEPSPVWATVTPVVLDRHPKNRGGSGTKHAVAIEHMRRIVEEACLRAGFPQPSAVEVSPVSCFPGVPHARSFALLRRKDGSAPRQVHATITFNSPISGPFLIGAGRFRGYGLCCGAGGGQA